ncbi:BPSS1780 family membrane protein [Massilia sp. 2TAF26]|uniref:BPSS1780 family membrane protein n=1 Tax=Massilia sp. 2TAF26 TaxID=3233012 RepID=UPI003F9477FF
MSTLPARTGWDWLKRGMGLFRKQPAALTTLLFASILLAIGISAVPIIGPIIVVVLIPSFSMAFMQACLMIDNGDRVTPAVLLTGFRKPVLGGLCKVGVIYLGVFLVLTLIALMITPESLRQLPGNIKLDPKDKLPFSLGDVAAVFGLLILETVSLLTLCFAAPLTYWKQMGPGKATFYSFFAVMRSARVFGVLLLSWFGIFTLITFVVVNLFSAIALAQVVLMWLMFLFILFLQCAIYAGYRDIFGKPAAGKETQPA